MGKEKISPSIKITTKKSSLGPPITWVINKNLYCMETGQDGFPIFRSSGFNYKATVAGTGSISWYIFCDRRQTRRSCPVQGVCHADGRLLMLRQHNHLPQVMYHQHRADVSVQKRITRSVQEKHNLDALIKNPWKSPLFLRNQEFDEEIHFVNENSTTKSMESNLCFVVKDRWKAARRESLLTKLREKTK